MDELTPQLWLCVPLNASLYQREEHSRNTANAGCHFEWACPPALDADANLQCRLSERMLWSSWLHWRRPFSGSAAITEERQSKFREARRRCVQRRVYASSQYCDSGSIPVVLEIIHSLVWNQRIHCFDSTWRGNAAQLRSETLQFAST